MKRQRVGRNDGRGRRLKRNEDNGQRVEKNDDRGERAERNEDRETSLTADEEEELLSINAQDLWEMNDISSSLVLDPVLELSSHKMSPSFRRPKSVEQLRPIITNFVEDQDYERAYDQLVSGDLQVSISHKPDSYKRNFKAHMRCFLDVFAADAGFAILPCRRYALENFVGNKVVATQEWSKGEVITNLVSVIARLNEHDRATFPRKDNCEGFVKKSSDTTYELWLGPAANVNHDCQPNCTFFSMETASTSYVLVVNDINIGDQITVSYGPDFFGKCCACETCERNDHNFFDTRNIGLPFKQVLPLKDVSNVPQVLPLKDVSNVPTSCHATQKKSSHNISAQDLSDCDDFASSLVLDPVLKFSTHKMNLCFHPPKPIAELQPIIKNFIQDQNYERTYQQLILDFSTLLNAKSESYRKLFKEHVYSYLKIFDTNAGFQILPTSRYSMDFEGAKVCATRDWTKGEKISNLVGVLAELTEKEEREMITDNKNDFSIMYSTRKNCNQLWLGPVAFVNHDCRPNCQFVSNGKSKAYIQVIKNINNGDEITVSYGDAFFDSHNKGCECETCERLCRGAYKNKKGSTSVSVESNSYSLRETDIRLRNKRKIQT